jgi:hypothetical protein
LRSAYALTGIHVLPADIAMEQHDKILGILFSKFATTEPDHITVEQLNDVWVAMGFHGQIPSMIKSRLLASSTRRSDPLSTPMISRNAFIEEFAHHTETDAPVVIPSRSTLRSRTGSYFTPGRRPVSATGITLSPFVKATVSALQQEVDELTSKLARKEEEADHLSHELKRTEERNKRHIEAFEEQLSALEQRYASTMVRYRSGVAIICARRSRHY